MSRFVRPDVAVLKISGGDTLTVKKRLNSGELRDMYARQYLQVDGRLRIDPFKQGITTVTAYLLDWSITDDDGNLVLIRDKSVDEVAAILDGLDPDDFHEILEAIEAHVDAMAAARELEKNARDGKTKSPATLPSLSDAAGDTRTCAT